MRFIVSAGSDDDVRRFERDSEDELWLLYKPSGYVLSVRGDGQYSHRPGSGSDKRRGVELRRIAVDA